MVVACTRSMSWVARSGAGSWAASWEVDMWLERFRRFWAQRLDALATELARGGRERRASRVADPATAGMPTTDNDGNREDDNKDEEGT